MSALHSHVPKPLQNAIHHVQNDDRYRLCPLYSVLLVWTIWVLYQWPWSKKLFVLYREYPWIPTYERIAEGCVLGLSVLLGLLGLARRGWLPKLVSIYAIYHAVPLFLTNLYWWWDLPGLWTDFTWYAFDVPIAWIHRHAGTDVFTRTSLYAVYLLALYLILRPPAKRLANHLWFLVLRIEDRIIFRYPFMERWNRPVL
jgi:hypothetical protein